ncbi:sensor histidine kinase [Endozoicomonas sp. SM1973]|uniref:histidine kinase n=1 Tax=Spartinivicinus marinus TaxID=2994442 RepID=A0A853IJR9_9GAMM|nr:sensor histidine kinase [Spartinivicinus marinus]MCX4030436.1 sensor histidine kinase [Spartinivicinus marinus]NYZ69637.1 sensor histidine kinase [Spartinivicinus marinus]
MSKTLKTVENNLVISVVISVITSIIVISISYIYVLNRYTDSNEKIANTELVRVIDNYKYNFLSKIGILVTSTEVVDFFKSGKKTRSELKTGVLRVMARMPKDNEVAGWQFVSDKGKSLINIGTSTKQFVRLQLCYLSTGLSAQYGECIASLLIYFNVDNLINKLNRLNKNIRYCPGCSPTQFIESDQYGFFNVESNVQLDVEYATPKNVPIWPLFIVSIAGLAWVGYHSKRHIRKILRRDVINPLTTVCKHNKQNVVSGYAESTVEEIVAIRMKYKLLQTKSVTAEQEKRKIANELHDALGSFIIKLRWEIAEILKRNQHNEKDLPLIRTALESVDYLLTATDNIIELLRPEVVDTLGIKGAIKSVISEWEELKSFTVDFSFNFEDTDLPDVVTHSAYRIVQEALTNIVKHSQATAVTIAINAISCNQEDCLQLIIKDNGKGLDYKSIKSGHGLSSMKERSVSLGGHFEITSDLNQGTSIEVILPLNFSIP